MEYFSPDPDSKYHDSPKGEMDIAYFDYTDDAIKYVEVKTRSEDVQCGIEQVRRAQEHFEELGFEFHGEVFIEGAPRLTVT